MPDPRAYHPSKAVLHLALGVFALVAIDCSPVVRVKTAIELPVGVTPDASLLHLTLATGTAPLPAPAPVVGRPPEHHELKTTRTGFVTEIHIRGISYWVQLTAWVDTNGSAKLDSGDFVGTLPAAVEAHDRGICAGNLTETPAIVLRAVP